jgi:hypothetical protein
MALINEVSYVATTPEPCGLSIQSRERILLARCRVRETHRIQDVVVLTLRVIHGVNYLNRGTEESHRTSEGVRQASCRDGFGGRATVSVEENRCGSRIGKGRNHQDGASGTAFGVHEARGGETPRVEEPANVLENVIM